MGGLIIILATVSCRRAMESRYVIVTVVAMLWDGLIGFLDELPEDRPRRSRRDSSRAGLVGQVVVRNRIGTSSSLSR